MIGTISLLPKSILTLLLSLLMIPSHVINHKNCCAPKLIGIRVLALMVLKSHITKFNNSHIKNKANDGGAIANFF